MFIYLVNGVQVPFGAAVSQPIYMEPSQPIKHIYVSSSSSIPVTLTPVDLYQVGEVTKLKEKLAVKSSRKRNSERSVVQRYTAGPWQMSVEMGAYQIGNRRSLDSSEVHGYIRVKDRVRDNGSPGILDRLCHVYREGEVKLSVLIENVKTLSDNCTWPYEMNIIDEDPIYISELKSYGVEKAGLDVGGEKTSFVNKCRFNNTLKASEKEACITIIAEVPDDYTETSSSDPVNFSVNKKLLLEEVCSDVTIVAENDVEIKCHKSYLAVHSSVFAAKFQTSMQESHTNTVNMPEMSEAGVRAFLAYLYCRETDEAVKNSLICFELFAAGREYYIAKLGNCMHKILLDKKEDWFDVDVAMKLFLLSRNLPSEYVGLKLKTLEILKSKRSVLENSPCYQQLFTTDPRAAMELCNIFLRCVNT